MSDLRTVAIDSETIDLIEEMGERLLREKEPDKGFKLLALCLGWRGMPERFECHVDESAGMAEVVELQGWSRRVPCS